jgi:hypothetical protein
MLETRGKLRKTRQKQRITNRLLCQLSYAGKALTWLSFSRFREHRQRVFSSGVFQNGSRGVLCGGRMSGFEGGDAEGESGGFCLACVPVSRPFNP